MEYRTINKESFKIIRNLVNSTSPIGTDYLYVEPRIISSNDLDEDRIRFSLGYELKSHAVVDCNDVINMYKGCINFEEQIDRICSNRG